MKNFFFSKHPVALLTVLCALLSTGSAFADVFGFGVTGGLNITKAKGDEAYNLKGWSPETDKGWNLGIKARVVSPVLGIGADASLLYSQEAISLGENIDDVSHQLAIPIHLRYEFSLPVLNNAIVPFAFAGPQFGWNLNDLDFDLDKAEGVKQNATDNYNKWKANKNNFNLRVDLGFGAMFFKHLEVFYNYSIPCSKTFSIKSYSDAVDKKNEIVEDYKVGVHRIGMSIYF